MYVYAWFGMHTSREHLQLFSCGALHAVYGAFRNVRNGWAQVLRWNVEGMPVRGSGQDVSVAPSCDVYLVRPLGHVLVYFRLRIRNVPELGGARDVRQHDISFFRGLQPVCIVSQLS